MSLYLFLIFSNIIFSRYLDSNILESLDEGIFDNMANLFYVSVSNNLLTHFPAFGSHTNLVYVDMSSNNIETIGYSTFANTPAISFLYVH